MTAICPACGTRVDTDAAMPGSVLNCPGCNQPFCWNAPATEELLLAGEEEDAAAHAADTVVEADSGAVLCTICKSPHPAQAKVCARCGAVLKRKHWDTTVTIPSSVATLPARRRPLTLLLLFAIVVMLVGGVIWLAGRLFVAVETPSIAYTRMAGMAAHGDWNRFYDRLHPRTLQGLSDLARGRAEGSMSVRQMFAAKDFGRAFMTIHNLPWTGFSITKEEVEGERAILTVKLSDGGTDFILMAKDQGLWKLRVPDVEPPE